VKEWAPLAHLRVVDFTRLLPGDYATLLLAAMGADVIKIEDVTTGDGVRSLPPFARGFSLGHEVLNRGKRSAQFDLKADADRELVLALIGACDVVVESFRPGVLDRLGLSDAALAVVNPQLVHVSLTAYGTGDLARMAGHDLNAQALAGLVSQYPVSEGELLPPALQVADLMAGQQVALAVVAAVEARSRTGAGRRIEISMVDAAYSMLGLAGIQSAAALLGGGPEPAPRQMLSGALACYAIYECSDGRQVALGALEPQFFANFCTAIGQPEWASLQFDQERQLELKAAIAAVVATRPQQHWVEVCTPADTCLSPVRTVAEALAAGAETGVVAAAALDGEVTIPVVRPVPWSTDGRDASRAPGLGADTEAVRTASAAGHWPVRGD